MQISPGIMGQRGTQNCKVSFAGFLVGWTGSSWNFWNQMFAKDINFCEVIIEYGYWRTKTWFDLFWLDNFERK